MKKNPEDNNLTKEALLSILSDNGDELKNSLARMQNSMLILLEVVHVFENIEVN